MLRALFRRRPKPVAERPPQEAPGEAERLLRRLDFTVVRRLDGLRQGDHRNLAYGAGLDLAELREYQPGDDVRALDWNVTARMDRPFVRVFHEDREVTAWLVLDLTASTDFGSGDMTKRELLIDAAGTVARLLTASGDKVGALLYTGSAPVRRVARPLSRTTLNPTLSRWESQAEKQERRPAEVVRAGSGRLHVLHVLERTMAAVRRVAPAGTPPGVARPPVSDLATLLEQTFRTTRERSLVVILSDFLETAAPPVGTSEPEQTRSDAWERALAPLARRHEVVGVWLRDPREVELPAVGIVTLQDAETGEQLVIDTTQPSLREAYAAQAAERAAHLERLFTVNAATLWTLSTAEPFVPAFVRFLDHRRRTLVGARRSLGALG